MKGINEHLIEESKKGSQDNESGIRYLIYRKTEPLPKSILRRLTLLWAWVRLRPGRYWDDEWAYFRREDTCFEEVDSSHPCYDQAEKPDNFIAKKVLTTSPWIELIATDKWLEQLGHTKD